MHEDAHLDSMWEDQFEFDSGLGEINVEETWEAGRDEAIAEHEAEMEQLQAEMLAEAEMARWDDDPNPYHGDYSEM